MSHASFIHALTLACYIRQVERCNSLRVQVLDIQHEGLISQGFFSC